jgi:hypothetical protein
LILSVSFVLLLAVLIWFLIQFAGLRGWHALVCIVRLLPRLHPARAVHPRRVPVLAGMAVAVPPHDRQLLRARGLATLAGWPHRLAWLLPVTLDAYARTVARV